MDDFKISLKAARVNKEMTQEQAAKAIGIDRVTLLNWERGKTYPDGLKLIELCELYEISINRIFLRRKNTLSGKEGSSTHKKGA